MNRQNKQQMIEALVNFSVESALERRELLEKLFLDGIPGFSRLSETQLVQEMRFRGLLGFDDENDSAEQEDANDDPDTELERLVLWSGMICIDNMETTTD